MNLLMGHARNLFLAATPDGRYLPAVELVLIASAADYAVDALGELHRSAAPVTFRLTLAADAARALANRLQEYAAEADALGRRVAVADEGGATDG